MSRVRWSPSMSALFEESPIAHGVAPLYEAPDPLHVEPAILELEDEELIEVGGAEDIFSLEVEDEEAISAWFEGVPL